MAKIVETSIPEGQSTAELVTGTPAFSGPDSLKFRDKLYTSRLLIVPGTDRSYPVCKAIVEVPASDSDAVKFLKASDEFEPFKE